MVEFLIGKGLDRGAVKAPTSAMGRVTGGSYTLLSWLESQLGMTTPAVSFTSRMVPYLHCLKECGASRFYSESLAKDEFGVARTLLQWRDTWYEAGWRGSSFSDGGPTRLVDLGSVEKRAMGRVPPGIGQRVQQVLDALENTKLDVSVTLLDAPDVFPKVWQQLFSVLEARIEVQVLEPQCEGDSDLAMLQRALVRGHSGKKMQLQGDGSFIVLRDGSPQLSAPWIARFAHGHVSSTSHVAVLAANHGSTLDDALLEAGFPQLGFADDSFWRPAFQVLPLALELIWRPLDPAILLQLLTHPIGPIARHIRQPLAEVVAGQPGIGGDGWVAAVDKALDQAVERDATAEAAKKRAEEAERLRFWLECERFEPRAGAPLDVLRKRVQRVSEWLAVTFNAQEEEAAATIFGAALGQSDELLRTLDRLEKTGTLTLTRESLRRLVEAVRGTGISRPGRPWQCAAGEPQVMRSDSPAASLAPVDTVIWWGCDKEHLPRAYPWSKSEIAALAAHDIDLLPINTQLEWQAASWLRPLLAARERLVLVLHDNAESHHPVFDQILAVAKGWVEERVDRLMREPDRLPGGLPATRVIDKREIPANTRWWRLPEDLDLPLRETESFTSLEKFLYAPHQWVLNYQARIRAGALAEVVEGSLLKGSLTHELFRRFFEAHSDIASIDGNESEAWARDQIRSLIEQTGAVLLSPGRQSEREYFVGMAVRSLGELIGHLQAANVVSVKVEEPLHGKFKGGGLNGSIDLLATNAAGQDAVVDVKWGGLGYRRDSLQLSKYLQLAVYAQLAEQARGRWPALGYYIIRDARLLMLDSDFFPKASVIRPDNGESHLEFWRRVEATWGWRREQIEGGLIEVPVTDTEPDEDSTPGELGLEMPETFDRFDDYRVLTGWSPES